jgi:F-type H+-transporting ATPase subunit a
MVISPDEVLVWQLGPVAINATIVYTWLVMALVVIGSWLVTRRLTAEAHISRGQNILEAVVILLRDQIREVSAQQPDQYLSFVGTLFIFIAVSNLLSIVPGFRSPAGSLSTTTALAICVFVAVPVYGITRQGLGGYLRQYLQPSPFMLPFNIIGEFSRTLALAVRLFGNVMSGTMIVGVLLSIVPLFFPIIMEIFGLLTGLIQAYIFAILAMVYIASATRTHHEAQSPQQSEEGDETHG